MSENFKLDMEKSMASNNLGVVNSNVVPQQNLRHNFSVWSLAALCISLMATWEALTSVVAAALTNGGAPCLFYN